LRAVAQGFGLTYDLLTGDLRQANYSSLRAGRLAFKRRLEAECIRDAMLMAAGELQLTPPVGSPV
jgi:capsid protein